MSQFYFATCQIGAEKALKAEISSAEPALKFAFSKPGFVTFKESRDKAPLVKSVPSIFTRIWGRVIDQIKSPGEIQKLVDQIPKGAQVQLYARDEFFPGDEPADFARDRKLKDLLNTTSFKASPTYRRGTKTFALIWVDDVHVFLVEQLSGFYPQLSLPTESPSRAYLKIQEASQMYLDELPRDLNVLEVGCAPGGASTFLLAQGYQVTGIDPKRMDPRVMKNSNYRHIQKMAKDVTAADLKDVNPDWLVLDMNLAPLETLDELASVISNLRKNQGRMLKIKKGFLTIKLNDLKFVVHIPLYLDRIQKMGFRDLYVTQLMSNRQEFFVFADSFQ